MLKAGSQSRARRQAAVLDVTEELPGAIQPEKLVGVNDFRPEEGKGQGLSGAQGLAAAASASHGMSRRSSAPPRGLRSWPGNTGGIFGRSTGSLGYCQPPRASPDSSTPQPEAP